MKTSAFSAVALLFFLVRAPLPAQEPRVPETPPPPELIGRWMEKNGDNKGELAGYNFYFFSRQSEFAILTQVRNETTKAWVDPKQLYPKDRPALLGYFEATSPNVLKFEIVALAIAVLPLEMRYGIEGKALSLSKNIFDPASSRGVKCERVERLPNESSEETVALQKRLEGNLNGPEFRQLFESAAHEMAPHPTDDAMLDNFYRNREQFEALRNMMQSDKGLDRVDLSFTRPEDPATISLAPERLEQYRVFIKKLGLERGLERLGQGDGIEFLASCRGLSVSGSSKTYVFLEQPPSPNERRDLVPDLDEHVRQRQAERARNLKAHKVGLSHRIDAYRPIDGHWYLHYSE